MRDSGMEKIVMQSTCQRFATAAFLFGASCCAMAGPPAPLLAAPAVAAHVQPSGYIAGIGQSLDSARLDQLSGGTDVRNGITLNGNVSNTSTDHTISGGNAIGSGAFSDAVGLPMVIQNSGNSVLIQNATIINVQLQP